MSLPVNNFENKLFVSTIYLFALGKLPATYPRDRIQSSLIRSSSIYYYAYLLFIDVFIYVPIYVSIYSFFMVLMIGNSLTVVLSFIIDCFI